VRLSALVRIDGRSMFIVMVANYKNITALSRKYLRDIE